MNKKKLISLCLVLCLAAIAIVGGTMAYFTDKDQAKNTFELGGVDITLTEREYVNGKWQDIENPDGVATLGQLDPGVVKYYNKNVFTINNEDAAYIRNYVAIEDLGKENNVYYIWFNNADMNKVPSEAPNGKMRHGAVILDPNCKDYQSPATEAERAVPTFANVTIDDKIYDIFVFDTIGQVAVEQYDSFGTLTTVSLRPNVTNEDVEDLGDTLEVYTFSEAIQEAGLSFDAAMKALIGNDADLKAHATRLLTEVMQ